MPSIVGQAMHSIDITDFQIRDGIKERDASAELQRSIDSAINFAQVNCVNLQESMS